MSLNNVNVSMANENFDLVGEQGAAIYTAVIIIWYSIGLALVLFLQMQPRTFQQHFVLDSPRTTKKINSSRNPFLDYRDVQENNLTKQILNELKDPERRQRLWKIYFSLNDEEKQSSAQYYQTMNADSAAIVRINRKLATIHQMDRREKDEFFSLFNENLAAPKIVRNRFQIEKVFQNEQNPSV